MHIQTNPPRMVYDLIVLKLVPHVSCMIHAENEVLIKLLALHCLHFYCVRNNETATKSGFTENKSSENSSCIIQNSWENEH